MVQPLPVFMAVGSTNGNCALYSPINSLQIFRRCAVSMGVLQSRKRSAETEHFFTQIPAALAVSRSARLSREGAGAISPAPCRYFVFGLALLTSASHGRHRLLLRYTLTQGRCSHIHLDLLRLCFLGLREA